MLVAHNEFGGGFALTGLIAVNPRDGVRPRPGAGVVAVLESADALRRTTQQSLVYAADWLPIGGGTIVIGRQTIQFCQRSRVVAVSHISDFPLSSAAKNKRDSRGEPGRRTVAEVCAPVS